MNKTSLKVITFNVLASNLEDDGFLSANPVSGITRIKKIEETLFKMLEDNNIVICQEFDMGAILKKLPSTIGFIFCAKTDEKRRPSNGKVLRTFQLLNSSFGEERYACVPKDPHHFEHYALLNERRYIHLFNHIKNILVVLRIVLEMSVETPSERYLLIFTEETKRMFLLWTMGLPYFIQKLWCNVFELELRRMISVQMTIFRFYLTKKDGFVPTLSKISLRKNFVWLEAIYRVEKQKRMP